MKGLSAVGIVLSLLAPLGCNTSSVGGGSSPSPTSAQLPAAAVTQTNLVLADSMAGLDAATLTTLKLSAVRDLWVRAIVQDVGGLSGMVVSFTSPQGDPFYRQEFPFSADPNVSTLRAKAGHMVDVSHPKAVAGGFALDVMIPIAGAQFDRYATAGTWTARVDVTRTGSDLSTLSQKFDVDVRR